MRLSRQQRERILATVRQAIGPKVEVRLFGSRLDDTHRGGDVDLLLIHERPISRLARAELKQALELDLHLPVDILAYTQGSEPTPFQVIALKQARPIDIEEAA